MKTAHTKTIAAAFTAAAAVALGSGYAAAQSSPTLSSTKSQGYVKCGVSQGLPGFSNPDSRGNWTGLDIDLCRAVAAAIFDDPSSVRFVPTSAKERFTALQSGEVDILSRNTTWTMSRDTRLGFEFAGVNYYDGQGFMVRKSLGVTSALDLDGAAFCTNSGTTTELNVADFVRSNNMQYELVAFEKTDEVIAAYDAGRCDVYTTDQSGLYANRTRLDNPDDHIVLPEIISKEPLGPVVRHGDNVWGDIVRWSLNAMLNAEELGVTSGNVYSMRNSDNPAIRRLLGVEGSFGRDIGLTNDWAYRIIRHVGNYKETFRRNLARAPLNIQRGVNALWRDGGLQYGPPIR